MQALKAFAMGALNKSSLPIGQRKIQRVQDIQIPAATNHQKLAKSRTNPSNSAGKVGRQNNVAITIANVLVAGHLLPRDEDGAHRFRAVLPVFDVRFIAQVQFPADFGNARLVAQQNNFYVWIKPAPALQGAALDDGTVALEGLGGR